MEFKSLIIVIVGFFILIFSLFVCYLAWAVDLGLQITDVGRSLYIGPFCPAMTSLNMYLEEAAFNISFSLSVFILLWLFSRCIMDIVYSIVLIACPSLRTDSENLNFPSAYLKPFLCSLYFELKFLLFLEYILAYDADYQCMMME